MLTSIPSSVLSTIGASCVTAVGIVIMGNRDRSFNDWKLEYLLYKDGITTFSTFLGTDYNTKGSKFFDMVEALKENERRNYHTYKNKLLKGPQTYELCKEAIQADGRLIEFVDPNLMTQDLYFNANTNIYVKDDFIANINLYVDDDFFYDLITSRFVNIIPVCYCGRMSIPGSHMSLYENVSFDISALKTKYPEYEEQLKSKIVIDPITIHDYYRSLRKRGLIIGDQLKSNILHEFKHFD